ncbi:MAG: P-loop NTPase fold protein [Sulfuricaulis sp.]|uniref:KAP family P-loop NTPase fold protein n=1 Tax=Sulfuricaulis sp. TaxID=2003553 RepID=UPI0025FDD2FC|nr:P-loop NTPase fold protein [Sulfuricaulis sp.]MCR4346107.1 P-loop NTPase fold protein [Sulfuricaulis sp.]
MWSDNETNRDFLNFRAVADTAAEIVVQAAGKPISIGITGGWGVGKSSMIRLVEAALRERSSEKFLFVQFNAWLYQGYDDARAALVEVIVHRLLERAKKTSTAVDKATALLERVNWLRAAALSTGSIAAIALGLPPIGIAGAAWRAASGLADGDITAKDIEDAEAVGKKAATAAGGLLKPKKVDTPPKEIQHLRDHFAATLAEMDVTLVVFVDDLDRCLPQTAIATLEAMRLFLFLDRTAFIIAADDKMIRESVRAHFKGVNLDDELVTNYFDKLIQVPIRVPPLGTQDVRAYLLMLFIENSTLQQEQKDALRQSVCKQLGETWQGKRVDHAFIASLLKDAPADLDRQLALADRLAHIMTTARQIAGNPRLIKRFLNTLSIRLAIARSQGVSVDEAALAKMLLFERCGSAETYARLVKEVNESADGKPVFLKPWEEAVSKGQEPELPAEWNNAFNKSWLGLAPLFSEIDLRPVVYVSREHMPIITAADQLSSNAADLLRALLEIRSSVASQLVPKLKQCNRAELEIMMERLLVRAKQATEWGTPPILYACLTLVEAEPDLSRSLSAFLRELPAQQLKASIVPLLRDKSWAASVFAHWKTEPSIDKTVRRAIDASVGAMK